MRHEFIDRFSDRQSPIHELDPRSKILVMLLFIVFVVLTPPDRLLQFAGYFLLLVVAVKVSGVPPLYVLARSALVLPFIVFVAVTAAFQKYNPGRDFILVLLAKSWLSALALTLLSSTTRFADLLKGLERLGVPKLMVMLLSFMYRYVFVLGDEAMRMETARDSRYFGGHYGRQLKVYTGMIGSLFVKTFERAERVYQCMAARGFDGRARSVNRFEFSQYDALFALFFAAGLCGIKVFL